MRKSVVVLVALSLLLVSLGCSALGGSGGGTGSGGSRSGVDVEVVNRSPDDICFVYISSSDSDSWGDSWLGDDEVVAAGKSATFNVGQGTYDVQVEDCSGVVMGAGWEFDADYTLTIGGSGRSVRVLVENDASTEVCYIYISPSNSDDWGDDWMSDMEQMPQGGRRMFYVKPGTYDLRADDCDGNALVQEEQVDLTDDLTWNLYDN